MESKPDLSKHARIRQTLTDAIANGQYEPGQRLPSESELVKTFGASRPTVNRALRELQLAGVIERRAGSGSYVRADAAARGYLFGLLIPELGRTEIFEPICRGMADAQHASHHALLWGSSLADSANVEEQASQASRAARRAVDFPIRVLLLCRTRKWSIATETFCLYIFERLKPRRGWRSWWVRCSGTSSPTRRVWAVRR